MKNAELKYQVLMIIIYLIAFEVLNFFLLHYFCLTE